MEAKKFCTHIYVLLIILVFLFCSAIIRLKLESVKFIYFKYWTKSIICL